MEQNCYGGANSNNFMKQKTCIGCGKVFYKTKNIRGIKWTSKKWCTHPCYLKNGPTNKGKHFAYKARPNQKRMFGKDNPAWKGAGVGYRALHRWVEQRRGKASSCAVDSTHQASRYHWANISRKYKRDTSDWINLCPKCHGGYDRKEPTLNLI